MAHFKVIYKSKTDGNCCTVWTTADYSSEAEYNVRDDYWDVEEIISIKQMSSD